MNDSRILRPVPFLFAVVLSLLLASAPFPVWAAELGDAEPRTCRWDLHPLYSLPGRAGEVPAAMQGGRQEGVAPAGVPDFDGLRATHRVPLLSSVLSEVEAGEFSIGLWVSDHVNQPVAFRLEPTGKGPVWSLGYVDGRVSFRPSPKAAPMLIETGRDTSHPRHKSHWLHVLLSVNGQGWRLFLNGKAAAEGSDAMHRGDSFELLGYLENEPRMEPGNLLKQVFIMPMRSVSQGRGIGLRS